MSHIEKQAKAVVSGYIDTMIFYLCEYADTKAEMATIAKIFCDEYIRVFFKTVSELSEGEE